MIIRMNSVIDRLLRARLSMKNKPIILSIYFTYWMCPKSEEDLIDGY